MAAQASWESTGEPEWVATFETNMPTGVTVSHTGRMFVCFPLWGDEVPATVAEVRNGRVEPYPDPELFRPDSSDQQNHVISVQSVVVDPADRLWLLDTGSVEFGRTSYGGPKLICVDLAGDRIERTILFDPDVALPTTYLNDVRFDLRRGEEGFAFITDSAMQARNGIIVVDLASGESWRGLDDHPSTKPDTSYLPMIEGRPFLQRPPDGPVAPPALGSDGIALSADGSRLYYCPFLGRELYSAGTDALIDRSADEAATVVDEGDKGGGTDGLECDTEGRLYVTSYEHNAVLRRDPDGSYSTLVTDPRLLFPDTLSLATDGYLYMTVNQLHRQAAYWRGHDWRRTPYAVCRVPVDASPVLLR
ncbi:sugar lactone lactonase YvrE [Halopolyspora algeriensis]|uniref:Sugar lactone lactonase YvrE n=1 Tax=Halopolyspora algeriensis TaxID=1500506 RepID=A0A368VTL8_9ACTN|nr:L-dopachrome tautomerase-related protein [Halopolyspora algeriensis]RCW45161.1 sugar lactone lactonase YvrE [Halopolyspora algeriensis]TQM53120.1 sugar lactone lactonase YvrE [Halopolyspora algeriensis]